MRNMKIFLTIWILAALSICLSVADAGNSTKLILQPEDREELRAFVEEARDFALQNGRDRALEVFNDSKGEFVRGDLYIFAFDFQGNLLANPVRPELIGQNRLNQTDPNGVAFVQDMTGLARGGSGSTYYIYPDPAENMTENLKMSYVTKIDDSWWLGSGIYF